MSSEDDAGDTQPQVPETEETSSVESDESSSNTVPQPDGEPPSAEIPQKVDDALMAEYIKSARSAKDEAVDSDKSAQRALDFAINYLSPDKWSETIVKHAEEVKVRRTESQAAVADVITNLNKLMAAKNVPQDATTLKDIRDSALKSWINVEKAVTQAFIEFGKLCIDRTKEIINYERESSQSITELGKITEKYWNLISSLPSEPSIASQITEAQKAQRFFTNPLVTLDLSSDLTARLGDMERIQLDVEKKAEFGPSEGLEADVEIYSDKAADVQGEVGDIVRAFGKIEDLNPSSSGETLVNKINNISKRARDYCITIIKIYCNILVTLVNELFNRCKMLLDQSRVVQDGINNGVAVIDKALVQTKSADLTILRDKAVDEMKASDKILNEIIAIFAEITTVNNRTVNITKPAIDGILSKLPEPIGIFRKALIDVLNGGDLGVQIATIEADYQSVVKLAGAVDNGYKVIGTHLKTINDLNVPPEVVKEIPKYDGKRRVKIDVSGSIGSPSREVEVEMSSLSLPHYSGNPPSDLQDTLFRALTVNTATITRLDLEILDFMVAGFLQEKGTLSQDDADYAVKVAMNTTEKMSYCIQNRTINKILYEKLHPLGYLANRTAVDRYRSSSPIEYYAANVNPSDKPLALPDNFERMIMDADALGPNSVNLVTAYQAYLTNRNATTYNHFVDTYHKLMGYSSLSS